MDSSYDSRIDLTFPELNDHPHSDTDLPNKVFRDLIGEFSGDWEGKEDVGVVCCVGQGWWLFNGYCYYGHFSFFTFLLHFSLKIHEYKL